MAVRQTRVQCVLTGFIWLSGLPAKRAASPATPAALYAHMAWNSGPPSPINIHDSPDAKRFKVWHWKQTADRCDQIVDLLSDVEDTSCSQLGFSSWMKQHVHCLKRVKQHGACRRAGMGEGFGARDWNGRFRCSRLAKLLCSMLRNICWRTHRSLMNLRLTAVIRGVFL